MVFKLREYCTLRNQNNLAFSQIGIVHMQKHKEKNMVATIFILTGGKGTRNTEGLNLERVPGITQL